MSKWTSKEVLEEADRLPAGQVKRRDMLREYAAQLAQPEWPSEENVHVAFAAFREKLSRVDGYMPSIRAMRAALQSVRPPAGVVSDDDVEHARLAIMSSSGFDPGSDGYIDDTAIRAALESYASRHAPTKD